MRYISTRGKAPPASFKEILLAGLAPDGGLYVPESYPQLDPSSLRNKGYVDVALATIGGFAPDIPAKDLRRILEKTYTPEIFGTKEITPVKMLHPRLGLLQLSNGPTLAFKDVAMQLLANLMEYVLAEHGENLNILGGTSGDTGGAALEAFRGKKGINVFMMSPHGRMSPFQQRQMYTVISPNIFNLVANGTFDDCQSTVKEVSADASFKAKYKIGAVNSINWARIVAQVVYYVYGYLQATTKNSQRITFVVPSGNFGNALSAYIARQMGLPIDIIIATNENDVLDEFFRTGIYKVRKGNEVKVTSSPSMDIASASNFERFIHMLVYEEEPELVADLWNDLKKRGQFNARFLLPTLKSEMRSGMATEAEVLETIRLMHEKHGIIIDPHTAVAMSVGLALQMANETIIVAETAQPAKFAETIRQALGFEPPVPKGFENLMNLLEHSTRIDPDAEVVKQFIREHI